MPEKVPTPDPVQVVQRGADAASHGDIDGSLASFSPDAVWDWADGLISWQANYTAIDEARVAAERIAGERG